MTGRALSLCPGRMSEAGFDDALVSFQRTASLGLLKALLTLKPNKMS